MIKYNEVLPEFLNDKPKINEEISITGKWVSIKRGGLFKKSKEFKDMLKEWGEIHSEAKSHNGLLSTEINHAIGQDAVLVHHVFKNSDSLMKYFANTAESHSQMLKKVTKPDVQIVKGMNISEGVKTAITSQNVPVSFGEYIFGFVRNDYKRPDPKKAIQVTAKWTCHSVNDLDKLIYLWKKVGADAFDLEKGLVRFEGYKVKGESALIIHETFQDSDELKFHLSKGTAATYKKELDMVAFPESYFFRGPVSWTIRTYSKFLKLPATYSIRGSNFTQKGGNMTDGTF